MQGTFRGTQGQECSGASHRCKDKELKSCPKSSLSPGILSSSLCLCLPVFSQSRSLHGSFSDFLSRVERRQWPSAPQRVCTAPKLQVPEEARCSWFSFCVPEETTGCQPGARGPPLGQSTWACLKAGYLPGDCGYGHGDAGAVFLEMGAGIHPSSTVLLPSGPSPPRSSRWLRPYYPLGVFPDATCIPRGVLLRASHPCS